MSVYKRLEFNQIKIGKLIHGIDPYRVQKVTKASNLYTYLPEIDDYDVLSYTPKNDFFSLPFVEHVLKEGDRLDNIAFMYYNDCDFYWVIAYFNSVIDPEKNITEDFSILKIPEISKLSSWLVENIL